MVLRLVRSEDHQTEEGEMIEVKVTYYPNEDTGEEPISYSQTILISKQTHPWKTMGYEVMQLALKCYDILVANSEQLRKEVSQ
jgi:hypothetical protein